VPSLEVNCLRKFGTSLCYALNILWTTMRVRLLWQSRPTDRISLLYQILRISDLLSLFTLLQRQILMQEALSGAFMLFFPYGYLPFAYFHGPLPKACTHTPKSHRVTPQHRAFPRTLSICAAVTLIRLSPCRRLTEN